MKKGVLNKTENGWEVVEEITQVNGNQIEPYYVKIPLHPNPSKFEGLDTVEYFRDYKLNKILYDGFSVDVKFKIVADSKLPEHYYAVIIE